MNTPKEIYVHFYRAGKDYDLGGIVHNEKLESTDVKFIRADLAELTAEDMLLAFRIVNQCMENCEGKTKREVFEEAAKLFNEQRQKK